MSLFGGLFSSGGPAVAASKAQPGGLFSDANVYKASDRTGDPRPQPADTGATRPALAKAVTPKADTAPPAHVQQPKNKKGKSEQPAQVDKKPSKKHKRTPQVESDPGQDSDSDIDQAPAQAAAPKQIKAPQPPTDHNSKKAQKKAKQPTAQAQEEPAAAADIPAPAPSRKRGHVSDDSSDDDEQAAGKGKQSQPSKPKLSPEEERERLSRTVWVGNLPATLNKKSLQALFSKCGAVDSVRLRSIPLSKEAKMNRRAAVLQGKVDTSRAPPIAYVVFKDSDSVTAALDLNMTEVEGHHIQVDRATRPSTQAQNPDKAAVLTNDNAHSVEYDPQRSLFCGNLHFHVTNEEVIQFFTSPEALKDNPELQPSSNGGKIAVEGCRVVRDPATNIGKGFAFVLFRTKAAARAAMSLNGRELHNRAVRLTRVSVQQQQKLKKLRQAATAPPPKPSGKGPGQGKFKGKKLPNLSAGNEEEWQGTKTKGKGKDVRGLKQDHKAVKSSKAGSASGGAVRDKGKRPAVAARKAKMLQQAGKLRETAGIKAGVQKRVGHGGARRGGKGPR